MIVNIRPFEDCWVVLLCTLTGTVLDILGVVESLIEAREFKKNYLLAAKP